MCLNRVRGLVDRRQRVVASAFTTNPQFATARQSACVWRVEEDGRQNHLAHFDGEAHHILLPHRCHRFGDVDRKEWRLFSCSYPLHAESLPSFSVVDAKSQGICPPLIA